MPVTKGAGNPDWTEDETILALDLLLRNLPRIPGKKDPEVIALSNLLRALPIFPESKRKENFRNPDGIGLKLMNLNAARTGKGLSSSKLDKRIWAQYGNKPAEVKRIADAIRNAGSQLASPTEEQEGEHGETVFSEGRLLSRLHTKRERNRSLRPKALKRARASGDLKCAACNKIENKKLGAIAEAMFEVHHIQPLSTLAKDTEIETKLSDLAILCADCHRLIHRISIAEGVWHTPEMLKRRL
jgi:5-methylcytosine-specific restriction protein A